MFLLDWDAKCFVAAVGVVVVNVLVVVNVFVGLRGLGLECKTH
jgi:hypothetical protein